MVNAQISLFILKKDILFQVEENKPNSNWKKQYETIQQVNILLAWILLI